MTSTPNREESPRGGLGKVNPPGGGPALRAAFLKPLSSGDPYPERHWMAHVVLEYSTSSALLSVYSVSHTEAQTLPPTAVQLASVQGFFGLTKKQLAEVCGVQRQTIYDWYAKKFEAEGEKARRLSRLFGLAERFKREGLKAVSERSSRRPLKSGETLVDLLTDEDREKDLTMLVRELNWQDEEQRSKSAQAARERLGGRTLSLEERNSILEENLEDVVDR